jgi:hypothetical protein
MRQRIPQVFCLLLAAVGLSYFKRPRAPYVDALSTLIFRKKKDTTSDKQAQFFVPNKQVLVVLFMVIALVIAPAIFHRR